MAKNRELTYSQALSELEKIVSDIESEEVDIDILAAKIKRASFLITFCKEKLRTTEEDVKTVLCAMKDDKSAGEPTEDEDLDE